ncbi:hypothetical protein [Dokdonella soli]|uniref:Uncharacterized protein n=1 Tax=Dokdonella soli TaxID=529810 RepID=A0ABP3U5B0_9GAMM
MSTQKQTIVFTFAERKIDGDTGSLNRNELQRLGHAAKVASTLLDSFESFDLAPQLSHQAIVVELPDSSCIDLQAILETTKIELISNANCHSPRKLARAVSSVQTIPFLHAAATAHATGGLKMELASDAGSSPFFPPPLPAFTEPKDRSSDRLKATFEIVGVCRDEDATHLVVIAGRRFLSLPAEYDVQMTQLQDAVFGRQAWYEGVIERKSSNGWTAMPGGRLVIQEADPRTNQS